MDGASRQIRLVTWLLLAVLLLRAAVPAGWMPQVDTGGIRVALCSGSGPIELILDADGNYHREAPATPTTHDPCPFGLATAQPLDLPSTMAVEAPGYAADPIAPRANRTAIAYLSPSTLRPPTRGPPLLA